MFRFSVVRDEVPDNEQERGNEEAEVVGEDSLNQSFYCHLKIFAALFLVCIVLFMCALVRFQEGSDHEEGEDADGEEDDFDMAGDETSDDSDSEELEEKGKVNRSETEANMCSFLSEVSAIRI